MAADAEGAVPARQQELRHGWLWHLENALSGLVLILIAVLPTAEILARRIFKTGILGASDLTHHLVLWLTCLGGAMTWSSLSLMLTGFDPANRIAFVPIQLAAAILPVGLLLITVHFIVNTPGKAANRALAALGLAAGTLISFSSLANVLGRINPQLPDALTLLSVAIAALVDLLSLAVIVVLIISTLLGTPVFIGLGGVAYLLFVNSAGALEVVPNEAYGILTSYSLPAIPLFTLVGFILSESQAGMRLIRLFKAFVGWLPGGMVIMVVLVCTFFTTFTGATGVTILALSALLSFALKSSGYKTSFSQGLITSSGSIGFLLPPSLPIILYGVTAQIDIKHMLAAGIIPGLLLVLCLCLYGVIVALRGKIERVPFQLKEAWGSVKESFWEILLPAVILVMYFLGLTTLVETGAVAVIYTLIVKVFIHRDLKLKDQSRVVLKCVPIISGILIIVATAKGLPYYIVDAEVPLALSAWVKAHVSSRFMFLLALNLVLLVTYVPWLSTGLITLLKL